MPAPAELRIAGILLAAGASRRMGTNKLLLQIEGEPMVRRACRRALAAGLDPVVVVLGHEAERVRAALSGLDCQFALNPASAGTMSDSVHAGLRQLPPACDATVILLADMVHVTADMLRELAARAAGTSAPLVVSSYGGILAPPTLFRRTLFPELLAATGEGCGKAVVLRHKAQAQEVFWLPEQLTDMDIPSDVQDVLFPG